MNVCAHHLPSDIRLVHIPIDDTMEVKGPPIRHIPLAANMTDQEKTGLGNYFVANYPPFSFWKPSYLPDAHAALDAPPSPDTPLGLYLHIPFCRKRCKFCYFRVYTDKNARDVETYLDALRQGSRAVQPDAGRRRPAAAITSTSAAARRRTSARRSSRSLMHARAGSSSRGTGAEEVTFECEPGTLQQHKLETLRELGVTRLSLGVENFDDKILESNGRAHLDERDLPRLRLGARPRLRRRSTST